MIDAWTAGTTAVYSPAVEPALVAVTDDLALANALATAAAEPGASTCAIEVRHAPTGATRSPGDWLPEIVFLLGQLTLGAGGNGLWAAIEHLWRRALPPRPALVTTAPPAERPQTRITVVVPVAGGEATIESVTLGPYDPEAAAALERLVGRLTDQAARRRST